MKKLIALLVMGVAVKLFLESKEGMAIRSRLKQLKKKAEDTFSAYIESKVLKITDKIEGTAKSADQWMEQHTDFS